MLRAPRPLWIAAFALASVGLINGCAPAPPSSSGWPDATNTGTSGALTKVSGDVTITTPNVTVANQYISGTLKINAKGVTVRNVHAFRITSWGQGTLIEDCDVGPASGRGGDNGIDVIGATVRRCDIHNSLDGMSSTGGNTIEDNWIHDLYVGDPAHNDGIQRYAPGQAAGQDVIRHNRIDCVGCTTSAVFYSDDWRGTLVLDNNRLSGGGYTFQLRASGSVTVTNNVFVKGSYGWGPCVVLTTVKGWSNNKLSDGTRVPLDAC